LAERICSTATQRPVSLPRNRHGWSLRRQRGRPHTRPGRKTRNGSRRNDGLWGNAGDKKGGPCTQAAHAVVREYPKIGTVLVEKRSRSHDPERHSNPENRELQPRLDPVCTCLSVGMSCLRYAALLDSVRQECTSATWATEHRGSLYAQISPASKVVFTDQKRSASSSGSPWGVAGASPLSDPCNAALARLGPTPQNGNSRPRRQILEPSGHWILATA
jgi:hypothetical protein